MAYDVNTAGKPGQRRLRHVAKACEDYGQRAKKSVIACLADPAQWAELRGRLTGIINENEDSLRFYFLGKNWKPRIEHIGAAPACDLKGRWFV